MRILLIGDSITEGFNTSLLLPEYDIINKGVYGDNTDGVLKRLGKDVMDEMPDIVSVLIGTNDFALEKTDDQIIENIEKIIVSLKETVTGIIICSILPVSNIINRPNERINSVNSRIEKLALKHNIKYWNIHKFFVNSRGSIQREYTKDGLHLSDMGYALWAKMFREYFFGLISNKLV